MTDVIEIQLEDRAFMPERAYATDAGLDLRCMDAVAIPSGGSAVVRTGVHVELPPGTCGLLVSKSGLNIEHGITTTGLIDEGYTGEIMVKTYNHSGAAKYLRRGDKVTQLVVIPCLYVQPVKVDAVEGGDRGDAGFGSTGR